jgi:GNAT superfamily N-acetyltransferase
MTQTKNSNFLIRPATHADIPALRRLIDLSVRGLGPGTYTPEVIEAAVGTALGVDAQLIEDGTYFIAEPADHPGIIAGSGGWSYRKTLHGGDTLPNRDSGVLDPATDAAKIRAIYVHPDWARRGLGSLILKHCEDTAISAGFRRLEMGSTLTGIPLYTLKGYEPRERVDIPLPNGEVLGILRMVKSVEASQALAP